MRGLDGKRVKEAIRPREWSEAEERKRKRETPERRKRRRNQGAAEAGRGCRLAYGASIIDAMDSGGEITNLISKWQQGDKAAEHALFEAVYHKLHIMALHYLRTERKGDSLGATALVHEAYLRFEQSERLQVLNRAHFLALAARVMRRILVDRARARSTAKRSAETASCEDADLFGSDSQAEEVLAVNLALESLARQSPRQAQLVELRYFGGFSEDETAGILGVSVRTIRRDWQVARTRLRIAMDGNPDEV
jgi:RNA polymerase sigma factor (TIGR02999 family)